jgi:FimV-like protein
MFNDTGVSGVTAEGVDLDLAAGDGRVDFDVVGGNTASNLAPNANVDLNLDLPSLGGEDDNRGRAPDQTASVVNLDELPALGSDKSGNTTAQMMPFANEVAETQIDLSMGIGDAPTVEQPALQGNPTIREKLDAAKRYGRENVSVESTAEVAIDDLGLDIGNVDGLDSQNIGDVETSSDAPTLVAGLDETSRRMIDEAARSRDSSATATLAALDGAAGGAAEDVDFELSDRTVERPNIQASNGGVEFDVGSATGFHAAPNVDTVVDDLTLPPLEPVTMSEVGTKLDLARAYIDMGDPDGARNILQEVMQEGSVMQKQEAQRLIDTLPG